MLNYPGSLILELRERACEPRLDSLVMVHCRGVGHLGGVLSAAEITAALFFREMRLDAPARRVRARSFRSRQQTYCYHPERTYPQP